MSQISHLCDEVMRERTRLGSQSAMQLLPGMTEEQTRELTAALPFSLPQSVIDLYKWSAGLPRQYGIDDEFFPGYCFNSLPEMLSLYLELSTASDYPRFRAGELQWFPIFRSSGTDFFGVLCGTSVVEDAAVVEDSNEGAHRDFQLLF